MIKKFKVECVVEFELDDDCKIGEELSALAADLCTEYATASDTFLPVGWGHMREVQHYEVSCEGVSETS